MISFIFAVILLGLTLGGVAARKTYDAVPLTELKRRAKNGDMLAVQLYRAAAFESSLRGFLWLFISLSGAGGFVLLTRSTPVWLSFIVVGLVLWIAFSWLPSGRVTKSGQRFTYRVTPLISWLLNYLHPILERIGALVGKRHPAPHHTGLYERTDLLTLLERQQQQADNRLNTEELDIVRHVLLFRDFKVRDVTISRKAIPMVKPAETIGPILIDELHKTGQDYVIVRDSAKTPIVGTLAIAALGLDSTGQVGDIMKKTVYYVHESDSLSDALHALFVTNHPVFIVTNSFEEYLGIITLPTILRKLLGHIPGDEFDQYADLQAVAARHAQLTNDKNTDDLPFEVIE